MITITVISGTPFIWTAREACKAREEYRIVGHLVGCLPRLPRQNQCLGLPLQLLKEEAALLKENGFAVIMGGCSTPSPPSLEKKNEFVESQKIMYKQQCELRKEERLKEMEACSEQIIVGKRKKMKKLLEQQEGEGKEIPAEKWEEIGKITFNKDEIEIPLMPETSTFVQIPTVITEQYEHLTPAVWKFPVSDSDKLRCLVFSDLWKRGFYLTAAGKFGGDFLVYPGDPSQYHSRYIAVCIPRGRTLNNLDMASMARLGTSVKKLVLLCFGIDDQKVNYTTLQWAGIS